jgi:hypothetical protein
VLSQDTYGLLDDAMFCAVDLGSKQFGGVPWSRIPLLLICRPSMVWSSLYHALSHLPFRRLSTELNSAVVHGALLCDFPYCQHSTIRELPAWTPFFKIPLLIQNK